MYLYIYVYMYLFNAYMNTYIHIQDEDAAHGVVPAEMTLLQALAPALGEEDDFDRPRMETNFSSFSITITEGHHNLTDGGEVCMSVGGGGGGSVCVCECVDVWSYWC